MKQTMQTRYVLFVFQLDYMFNVNYTYSLRVLYVKGRVKIDYQIKPSPESLQWHDWLSRTLTHLSSMGHKESVMIHRITTISMIDSADGIEFGIWFTKTVAAIVLKSSNSLYSSLFCPTLSLFYTYELALPYNVHLFRQVILYSLIILQHKFV